jgi:hypothetical protein
MKNLKLNLQQIGGERLSREQMKKVLGGEVDPAPCAGVTCPPGMSLVVRQISGSAYVCTCVCGDTSYCY